MLERYLNFLATLTTFITYILTTTPPNTSPPNPTTQNTLGRSIDIRHHEIKQDYVEGDMRIGGVSSANNTADILTKNLQPPLHAKHCASLHILNPTITAHNNTLHNMAVFATKTEPPERKKQRKRRAKKQRKRERDNQQRKRDRDNKLIALAQHTLRHHHNRTTTDNGWLLLEQMHIDRDIFPRTHNPAPPNLVPPRRRTRHPQCPTCISQPPNRANPVHKKRHTHSQKTHTTPRSDPRITTVDNKRMPKPTARRREAKTISILTKREKTKIQKFHSTKNQPVNTKTQSKRENDKKTQKPKRNRSQIFSHTQPHRTKDQNLARSKNVPNTTKFCPTSYSSSEFGQTYASHKFELPQIPNSQINLPNDQHLNTMPTTKQLEVIRLQQAAVVSNLVEIARYTHTKPVYTEMTQQEFNKTIRNLHRISTLCTRSIKATRHGQTLAPKIGPYAHYYRLFDDFCEILQLESDRILTQKEYLLDHKYRLVPKPPTPPKTTGLRNIVNHYFGESDDEASPSSPQYSPNKSDVRGLV
jgi:hypothetical protein